MGWILLYHFVVTLTVTTAYNYGHYGRPLYDYPHERVHPRRIESDTDLPDRDYYGVERLQERSAETNYYRPAPRMNERSIAVTSGIQRVQERERVRVQPWGEVVPRSENGSYKIVNNQLKYPSISNRRGALQERISDTVVFPGMTSAQKYVPEIPKECEELGICDNVPNYPHDIINSIIDELGDKLNMFKVEELEAPEIAQRLGPDDNSEVELCNYRQTVIIPQSAQTKKGEWYYILNRKENPLQGYRMEVCQSNGQSCATNIVFFYDGYTSLCKQKYVQRTMTAVDVEKREVLYNMPFRLPSCCSCVAIHNKNKK